MATTVDTPPSRTALPECGRECGRPVDPRPARVRETPVLNEHRSAAADRVYNNRPPGIRYARTVYRMWRTTTSDIEIRNVYVRRV